MENIHGGAQSATQAVHEITEALQAGNRDLQGIAAVGGTPEEFGAYVSSEIKRWTTVARANKIMLEQ